MRIDNENNTLAGLLAQVQDQAARKQDYVAPTSQLQVSTVAAAGLYDNPSDGTNVTRVILEGAGGAPTEILETNDVAFDQLVNRAGLDVRTGRRLREGYPDVLDHALNRIHEQEPRGTMLRTFDMSERISDIYMPPGYDPIVRQSFRDGSQLEAPASTGILRAVVSDKFKAFDNPDLLEAVLPPLIESDAEWQIVNADITDKRLYARFKSLAITGEGAAVGDLMAQGVVVSNSETSHGSVSIAQLIWTLFCLNGMETANKNRTAHLTSSKADGDTWAVLTDETKRLDNVALAAKLRDITAHYASREMFESVLEQFRAAAGDVVADGPGAEQAAVAALGGVLRLTKAETSSVLDGLMETIQQDGYRNQPLSRATMVNAVTAAAHHAAADDVSDWQRRGSTVLNLPANQWQSIATAPVAVAA